MTLGRPHPASIRAGPILALAHGMDPLLLERVLRGYIGDAALHLVLNTLAADPAWTLGGTSDQPSERVLLLTYHPTSVSYVFRATLAGPALWHFEG